MHRARNQPAASLRGHIVTWDVDSRDRALCAAVNRFVLGHSVRKGGRTYRYPGLVGRRGVRYLGQSVIFVTAEDLPRVREFFARRAIAHHLTAASLGRGL